jgi:hypothetical protein
MTASQSLSILLVQQMAATNSLDKLPAYPNLPPMSGMWGAQRDPREDLTAAAAGLHVDIRLRLLEKNWITANLDVVDLLDCVKSKSPLAVAFLSQFDDLLFRLISLPITLKDAEWVRDTFHLDANAVSHQRTLLSCITHLVAKRNDHGVRALEKIHALGYRFSSKDEEYLGKRFARKSLPQHDLMMALAWFSEQVEIITGENPFGPEPIVEPAIKKVATLGARQLDLS